MAESFYTNESLRWVENTWLSSSVESWPATIAKGWCWDRRYVSSSWGCG